MIYSSASTKLGRFFDLFSYYSVMALLWAFGAVIVGGFLLTLVCFIIQVSGGHHFLMDAF